MTERQEAAVAEQQVEGAGEEREAQHLHEEDRIEQERRHREEDRNADENGPMQMSGVHRRPRARRRCHSFADARHHAVLPNSPAGLTSSTTTMTTNITVAAASG